MSRTRLYAVVAGLGVTASVALALLFAVSRAGPGAVTGVAPEAFASSVDAEAANAVASASGGGYGEGIKVHGRWTLEVRDPDGTLVERREFDNALVSTAPITLARAIGGITTMGFWTVLVGNGTGLDLPCHQAGTPDFCGIVESPNPINLPQYFSTLTVDVPTSGPNFQKLVLSGTATAMTNGSLNLVKTRVRTCVPTTAPDTNCVSAGGADFEITQTSFTPMTVAAGQQILVTVVISFS